MLSNDKARKILSVSLLGVSSMLSLAAHCRAQSIQDAPKQEMVEKAAYVATSRMARRNLENYKGQNGILSMKTLVLGGEFRVTTVIPFRGNVADYDRLESSYESLGPLLRIEPMLDPLRGDPRFAEILAHAGLSQ